LNNVKPTGEAMNSLNDFGLTPFLAYIEQFCSSYSSLRGKAMLLVNAEAEKHGLQFSRFKITNESLFKKNAPTIDRVKKAFSRSPYGGKSAAVKSNPFNAEEEIV
jgi:hypothetical protein